MDIIQKIDELIEILKESNKKTDKIMSYIEVCLSKLTDHEIRISKLEKTVFK